MKARSVPFFRVPLRGAAAREDTRKGMSCMHDIQGFERISMSADLLIDCSRRILHA